MQLILDSVTEIGVNIKMTALDEESLDEKLVYDDLNDVKNGDLNDGNKVELDNLSKNLTYDEKDCPTEPIREKEIAEISYAVSQPLDNKSKDITNSDLSSGEIEDVTIKNLDAENMDLVLQKEAEILDDEVCVEDIISLAKKISESNEKLNELCESNKSVLDITSTDPLEHENSSPAELFETDVEETFNKELIKESYSDKQDEVNATSEQNNSIKTDLGLHDIINKPTNKDRPKIFKDDFKRNDSRVLEENQNMSGTHLDKNEGSCNENEFFCETQAEDGSINNNASHEVSDKEDRTVEELSLSSATLPLKNQEIINVENIVTIEKEDIATSADIQMTDTSYQKPILICKDSENEDKDMLDGNETTEKENLRETVSSPKNFEVLEAEDVEMISKDPEKVNMSPPEKVATEDEKIMQPLTTCTEPIEETPRDNVTEIGTNVSKQPNLLSCTPETKITEELKEKHCPDDEIENLQKDINLIDHSELTNDEDLDLEKKDEVNVSSDSEVNVTKSTCVVDLNNTIVEKNCTDLVLHKMSEDITEAPVSQVLQSSIAGEHNEKNIDIAEQNKSQQNEESNKTVLQIVDANNHKVDSLSNSDTEPMELDTPITNSIILTSPVCTPEKNNTSSQEEIKEIPKICRLSNNLDILSDDEDEDPLKEKESKSNNVKRKSIHDDDDIMLIDEYSDNKNDSNDVNETETQDSEKHVQNELDKVTSDDLDITKEKTCDEEFSQKITNNKTDDVEDNDVISTKITVSEKELENKHDIMIPQKPLLPNNFLQSCKKNLVDMTREDLEEFCILKIVESIVDRSSLSEIKSKIKTMSQNLEDYKKKALTLTKQNRDLQVVLKSVQEEQKKRTTTSITPLKITRSVGMQIVMSEPTTRRKGTAGVVMPVNVSSGNSNNSVLQPVNNVNTRQLRNSTNQNQRNAKANNAQQIPVPRLVPASNNPMTKTPPSANSNNGKTNNSSPIPNGIKSPAPANKSEKRAHNRITQSPSSVTVDLTDDEPPPKVAARSPSVPPVRLVPPQNLMPPQRPQFPQQVNSPRKVYIPISGPQGSVRPGQTIMLKSIPAQNARARGPSPNIIRPGTQPLRRHQGVRHPAPLPDAMKQYQPPNWKALPPAPDLKLSKVENGIVISWKIEGYQEDSYEEIASYQLYAYQETSSPPSTALWKKIGDVKALPLPMACTLTQFMAGYKYYFAVRAVDVRSRVGPFSLPGSILLLSKT